MGKSCCSTKIPPLRTDNNEYAYTNEEKSEVLNNFFCTESAIDDANVNLPNFELRTNNTLSNVNILQSEVIDILNLLKVNKAIGPDGISHRMLKYTSKTISVPLIQFIIRAKYIGDTAMTSSIRISHVFPDLVGKKTRALWKVYGGM